MLEFTNCFYLDKQKIHFLVSENGCWLCIGRYIDKEGYAQIRWKGRLTRVHRAVYQFFKNLILPKHIHVRHKKCDNPICVNPDHLDQGTAYDNGQDKILHGRQPKGEQIPSAKLSETAAKEILRSEGKTIRELAEKFNVSPCCIWDVLNGITWKHILPTIKRRKSKKHLLRMTNKPAAKNIVICIDKNLLNMPKP